MNFLKRIMLVVSCRMAFVFLAAMFFVGCGGNESDFPPLSEQLNEFQNAGPLQLEVNINQIVTARIPTGPYRLSVGDLLELQIPSVLQVTTAELSGPLDLPKPYLCRVYNDGTITVPLIGQIEAAGKSLAEVELAITEAYFPKYCFSRPSVVAQVSEYRTAKVSIIGAVEKPGVYELRMDQMSLVSLIMEAGGIIDDGATVIRITSRIPLDTILAKKEKKIRTALRGFLEADNIDTTAEVAWQEEPVEESTIVLPVKGLNIPFADVALREGDRVVVEGIEQPIVTVVGLVNKPGNFPYPPNARYNLMQALAFAGGFNLPADPRYTTVYRQKPDGTTVSVTFEMVNDSKLTDASSIFIKPGDIISVEQTPQTRTNLFLDRVFRINTGIYTTMRMID